MRNINSDASCVIADVGDVPPVIDKLYAAKFNRCCRLNERIISQTRFEST